MSVQKLIMQVRVNESQMRTSNAHVPYSPEEIAEKRAPASNPLP